MWKREYDDEDIVRIEQSDALLSLEHLSLLRRFVAIVNGGIELEGANEKEDVEAANAVLVTDVKFETPRPEKATEEPQEAKEEQEPPHEVEAEETEEAQPQEPADPLTSPPFMQ